MGGYMGSWVDIWVVGWMAGWTNRLNCLTVVVVFHEVNHEVFVVNDVVVVSDVLKHNQLDHPSKGFRRVAAPHWVPEVPNKENNANGRHQMSDTTLLLHDKESRHIYPPVASI